MTNHPHRRHDENEPTVEELAAEALQPPETAVIPPQGSAEVPAHTGNGVPPGLRPNAAKLIGQAVAETLGQVLPQILFNAFVQALSSVQVTTKPLHCATCFVARVGWFAQHAAEVEAARAAMEAAAAELDPADPRRGMLNPVAFLPEHLRPSAGPQAMPGLAAGEIMMNGTLHCAEHAPGVQQPGRSPLLVATATMNPAMFGQFAGTG